MNIAPDSVLLPAPDPSFHLSVEVRSTLHPRLDPDVFERLLAWFRPEYREQLISAFQFPPDRKVAVGPIQMAIPGPEVQRLIEQVNESLRVQPGAPPPL